VGVRYLATWVGLASLTRLYSLILIFIELNDLLVSKVNSACLARTRLLIKFETRLGLLYMEFKSRVTRLGHEFRVLTPCLAECLIYIVASKFGI
jgi:hypothetical protein